MIKIKRYGIYKAVFRPKDLETLRPEMHQYIDQDVTVQAIGTVQAGMFKGQWEFYPVYDVEETEIRYFWFPEEDLVINEDITKKYYASKKRW